MNTQQFRNPTLGTHKVFPPLLQWVIRGVDTGLGLRGHFQLEVGPAACVSSLGNSSLTIRPGQDTKRDGLTSLVSHSWVRGLSWLVSMSLKGKRQDAETFAETFLAPLSSPISLYLIKQDSPPALKADTHADLVVCSEGGFVAFAHTCICGLSSYFRIEIGQRTLTCEFVFFFFCTYGPGDAKKVLEHSSEGPQDSICIHWAVIFGNTPCELSGMLCPYHL